MRIKNIKKNTGISIIETLFYIALFVMLSIVVINAMITMMKSFKQTSIERNLAQSGTMMEAMSREIRKAYGVASVATDDLSLNTLDDSGNNKTVEFAFSGTNLLFKENGTLTGNLNAPNISVITISFTGISTAKGKAVRIILETKDNSDISGRTEKFYDTIALRGNY